MSVSKKEIEHMAHLARLHFSEEEIEHFTQDLDTIIQFAEKIKEVDTENIAPTSRPSHLTNVVREDQVRPSLPVEEALQNTAKHRHNQFQVPRVIEE